MTRDLHPCGTQAAYQRHQRRGEIACDPCLQAAARYRRITYQRKRQAADHLTVLFRELLDLISGECERAGMLP